MDRGAVRSATQAPPGARAIKMDLAAIEAASAGIEALAESTSNIFPAIATGLGTLAGRRWYKDMPKRFMRSGPTRKPKRAHLGTMRSSFVPTMPPSSTTRTVASRFRRNLGVHPSYWRWRKHRHEGGVTSTPQTGRTDKQLIKETTLIKVPWANSPDSYNKRRSKLAYIHGVKMRMTWRIRPDFPQTEPIHVRWAILNPRENTGKFGDINEQRFFVSPNFSLTDEGFTQFPNVGAPKTSFEYMNRSINFKEYGIVKQGTFVFEPSTTGTFTIKSHGQVKTFNMYIPIKRILTFPLNNTTEGNEDPETNIHLVWWYCNKGDPGETIVYPSSSAVSNSADACPIQTNHEIITYFRNILP